MSESTKRNTKYFSQKDQLHLLQLRARKAVHENRNPDDENKRESEEFRQAQLVPREWRLIPKGIDLYRWQEECLVVWKKNDFKGTVKVATGGGKTLFALAAAQFVQNNREQQLCLVIVVPTIVLMNQWYEEFQSSNLPREELARMGGGNLASKLDLSKARVMICVLASAKKHLPKIIKSANWEQKMMLIVDECHKAGADQARNIFQIKPIFTLGLSATPERSDESVDRNDDNSFNNSPVGKALGSIIFDYTIDQCFRDGLLPPFEVHHIGLPLTDDESRKYQEYCDEISNIYKSIRPLFETSRMTDFNTWCQWAINRNEPCAQKVTRFKSLTSERKRLLYGANSRIEFTLAILSEFAKLKTDGKAILFHENIHEVETLFDQVVKKRLPVVLEHSKLPTSLRDDSIEAFRNGTARIILSVKSLVEGFNVPSADLGIICASSSSVRQRIQSLGRMLRRKPNGEEATIYALYINNTVDVDIYKKIDWEEIVGSKRNRYFTWNPPEKSENWRTGLLECNDPPIKFKLRSECVDVENLRLGDEYPGQLDGENLRVDNMKNLRTRNGYSIVRVEREVIDQINELICHGNWCHLTEAGHLVTREPSFDSDSSEANWVYKTNLGARLRALTKDNLVSNRLLIKQIKGKQQICKSVKGGVEYASGPEESIRFLLDWIKKNEAKMNVEINEIYWDEKSKYWLEIYSKRHYCRNSHIAPLKF